MTSSNTLIAAALCLSLAGVAQAQAPSAGAAALQGQQVRGQGGVVLGHVERVILRPDGTAAQVLVRPKGNGAGGPRSLSRAAIKIEADGLSTPLTQAEFNAMPAVDVAAK